MIGDTAFRWTFCGTAEIMRRAGAFLVVEAS